MNRLSGQWSSHQTTAINGTPTPQILLQLLKLAESNIGQPFTVTWSQQETLLYLEVLIAEQAMRAVTAGRKESGETQMRWIHGEYVKSEFGKQERRARWTHLTRDIGLVCELLADTFTPQKTVEVEDRTPAPIAAPLNSGHELPKRTGRFNALKLTKNTLPTVSTSSRNSGDVTLSGELNKVELTGILQSISICKMTGRLDLQDTIDGIEIYFADGLPVHACQMKMLNTDEKSAVGDQVLLSALIWNTGSFCFNPDRKTSERSIKRKLEVLLLEGACLKDYSVYLQAANINARSVLHRKAGSLSEEAFAEKLAAGMPMDIRLQHALYESFDGVAKLGDLIAKRGLQKPVWVPVVFNLLSCNLIGTDEADAPKKESDRNERVIDPAQITKAERDLARYETGFLSFPLLMLFLQSEVDRYIDSGAPLALVIFEIWHKQEAMSNEKLQRVSQCFRSIAASYDLIGHYKDFEFAMLLPLKEESDTREFVEIFQKFVADCFDSELGADSVKMTCGIVTADSITPGEFDLQSFVTAAVKAKRANKQRGSVITSYRQLAWEELSKQADRVLKGPQPELAIDLWKKLYDESILMQFDRYYWGQAAERYASLLLSARRYGEVESILTQLIRYKTELAGPDDISTITTAGELAHCYYAQGKYSDAEWLIQGVLAAYAKHYGDDCALMATWYYNLATLYHVQHKYASAEPMYKKALDVRMQLLGAHHADTIKSKNGYDSILRVINPEPVPDPANGQLITGSWMLYQHDENESVL